MNQTFDKILQGEFQDEVNFKQMKSLANQLSMEAWPDQLEQTHKARSHAMLAKLLEEAGELAGECKTFHGRSLRPDKQSTGNTDEIEGELGDCLVVLLRIAEVYEIDPDLAVQKTLKKFNERLQATKKIVPTFEILTKPAIHYPIVSDGNGNWTDSKGQVLDVALKPAE